MSGKRKDLDRDYEATRPAVLAMIEVYRQAEGHARAGGDTESADELRDRREILERNVDRIEYMRSGKHEQMLLVKWRALVKAHRATGKRRPSLMEVAEQMGWNSEQPLRDYCRELRIEHWHDVHPIVAATPD